MLKNSKGITILELLVALTLSSIVITLGVQFYITNSSTFTYAQEKSKLSSQAQEIQNILSSKVLQSEGISAIKIDGIDCFSNSCDINKNIDIVTFKLNSSEFTFKYLADSNEIFMNDQMINSKVSKIIMLPIPEGYSYEDAKGVKVVLELTEQMRRPVIHEITTILSFRNK